MEHAPSQPLDAITAFAVPNPNCSSQSRRFFRVWSPCGLPRRADHPAYFGLATDVIVAAEKWYEGNKDDHILNYELQGIKDVLKNIEIVDIKGIAVYVDEKIVAFSLGEKLNDNLAVIHIEKADMRL